MLIAMKIAGRVTQAIRAHPLMAYFVLAYALTWMVLVPALVAAKQPGLKPYFWLIVVVALPGVFGPSIAALIVTGVSGGGTAVRALLRKYLVWRVGLRWWLFALGLPFAYGVGAVGLSHALRPWITGIDPARVFPAFPVAILAAIPFGPLPEELGWRGVALPRLLERFSPLRASLVLGTAWTFWHAPQMLLLPGASFPSVFALSLPVVALYLTYTVAETVIMTFLWQRTSGSVLLAIVYHAAANAWENTLLPTLGDPPADSARVLYYMTVAVIVVVAAGLMILAARGGVPGVRPAHS